MSFCEESSFLNSEYLIFSKMAEVVQILTIFWNILHIALNFAQQIFTELLLKYRTLC